MDEGRQPLSEAEQQQMQAEQQVQAAEAQTGKTAVPRTMATEDPTSIDPRFDRDDLRQGKPPPAVKKHKHMRIRRKRNAKGTPLTKEERASALGGTQGDTNDGNAADQGEMTDEEFDLTDDEGAGVVQEKGQESKPGLLGKMLGKG